MSKNNDGLRDGKFDNILVNDLSWQEGDVQIGRIAEPADLLVTGDLTVNGAIIAPLGINATTLLGKTWAAPDPIGTTTPAAGTFTTLNATTVIAPNNNASSLLTKTWAAPDPIGTTTPAAGTFTTLNAETLTANQSANSTIISTQTNANAGTDAESGFRATATKSIEMIATGDNHSTNPSRGIIRSSSDAFGVDVVATGAGKRVRVGTDAEKQIQIYDDHIRIETKNILLYTTNALGSIEIGAIGLVSNVSVYASAFSVTALSNSITGVNLTITGHSFHSL